jgi:hypothetical protein
MGRKRKHHGPLKAFIRKSYKALSLLNTAEIIMSGDIAKISRHMARKRTIAIGSKIIPGKK